MKKMIVFVAGIFVSLLLSINMVAGQCVGLTQGSTFTNVSGSIITTTAFSSDTYINGDLTITATGDLTINAKNVKVANDVQITVQSGGVLRIKNGTDIYGEPGGAGGFYLWDGILVEGGGILEMDDSQIFYARIAIQANNSGSYQSELYISNSCFENNDIGVYFGPNAIPDASVSVIESTEFYAPDLVDDLNNEKKEITVYL